MHIEIKQVTTAVCFG